MKWTVEPSGIPGLYDVYDEDGNRVVRHTTLERANIVAAAPSSWETLERIERLSRASLKSMPKWINKTITTVVQEINDQACAALGKDKG